MAYKRVTAEERKLIYRWRKRRPSSTGDCPASGSGGKQHLSELARNTGNRG